MSRVNPAPLSKELVLVGADDFPAIGQHNRIQILYGVFLGWKRVCQHKTPVEPRIDWAAQKLGYLDLPFRRVNHFIRPQAPTPTPCPLIPCGL